jgi:cell division protein WhiA
MTFTQEVKRELAAIVPDADHCRRAQLSGLLFGAGTFEIASGGEYAVRLSVALASVARCLLSLLKPMGVEAQLRTADSPPQGRRYEVVLGDDARHLQVLNETGVLSDAFRVQWEVPRRIVERRCCAIAFARGAFLGCGSISTPGAPVHAEFTFESTALAEQLARVLGRQGLRFAVAERVRNVACYTKRGETAADLLAMLGAHDARLRWEEHLVLGRVRESANRLANCDQANADRAARAALRQVEAARAALEADDAARETGRGAVLTAGLRAAAELRLKYPYLSLTDLARKARPRLSKGALNHRLRRLEASFAAKRGKGD